MAAGQYSGGIGAIAGAVIGGIIGNYTGVGVYQGAMWGASIGGMAGGIAGQVFWPEKVDLTHPLPPKPHETRVQISTYGAPIPIQYDDGRMAGNIIYMSDINTSVSRYNYRDNGVRMHQLSLTYTSTFAIAFCEAVGRTIARIWVNGKVFADYRDPAGPYYPTGSVGLASANLDTSIARSAVYFTIYDGTETQTADPSIAAILTEAETPTYRGITYIVFKDFPVGEFSGVPTIEVELAAVTTGSVCSEYFIGSDDSAPSTDLYTNTYGVGSGSDPTIQSNKLQFAGDPGTRIYTATFNLTGEFDIYFDFYRGTYDPDDAGNIALFLTGTGSDGIYYEWNSIWHTTMFGYSVTGPADNVDTSELSYGKLRLTRNGSDDVYAYYWNDSLSRWEWDGNTIGTFIANLSGDVTPKFYIQRINSGEITSIGDIIVAAGCSP